MAVAAVGQLCSTSSMAHNLVQCQVLVRKAVAAGAKALFLPEASDYIAPSPAETVSLVRSVRESEFVLGLQNEARKWRLPINVGVHEPAEDQAGEKKVKNTLLWIDENGNITQRYQKIHLFDVDMKDGPSLRESSTSLGCVGLSICFDLRFPEISLTLRRLNAQIITYPSAFTVSTGQAHWEPLLRARAIETQSYIIAAAQAGKHNHRRISYGHSMIVDPWGEVVARLGAESAEPAVATAEIDLEFLEKVRREMPLLRRTDVYPEV